MHVSRRKLCSFASLCPVSGCVQDVWAQHWQRRINVHSLLAGVVWESVHVAEVIVADWKRVRPKFVLIIMHAVRWFTQQCNWKAFVSLADVCNSLCLDRRANKWKRYYETCYYGDTLAIPSGCFHISCQNIRASFMWIVRKNVPWKRCSMCDYYVRRQMNVNNNYVELERWPFVLWRSNQWLGLV